MPVIARRQKEDKELTFEELLLAERILSGKGYRYLFRYGQPPNRYCLRARRWRALSARGLREKVLVIESANDLSYLP